jgi:hypothetical protein
VAERVEGEVDAELRRLDAALGVEQARGFSRQAVEQAEGGQPFTGGKRQRHEMEVLHHGGAS